MWDSFNGGLTPGNYGSLFSPNVEFNHPGMMGMGMGMMPPVGFGMMNPMMGMGAGLAPLPYDTFQRSGQVTALNGHKNSFLSGFGKIAMGVGAAILLWKGGKGIGKLFKKFKIAKR